MVLLEVVDVEVFQEFDINKRSIAVLDIGALVKLGQRLTDIEFWHLVLLDQDTFEIRQAFPGLGNRIIQLVLADAVVRDQEIELGRGFFGDLAEVEEGDAERLGNLCDGFFVFSREPNAAFLLRS